MNEWSVAKYGTSTQKHVFFSYYFHFFLSKSIFDGILSNVAIRDPLNTRSTAIQKFQSNKSSKRYDTSNTKTHVLLSTPKMLT